MRNKMSSTTDVIQQKNFEMVEYLPDQISIINSIDSCVEEEDDTASEAEVLHKINASDTPLLHKLNLKPVVCTI
jgi:hypothetical protein